MPSPPPPAAVSSEACSAERKLAQANTTPRRSSSRVDDPCRKSRRAADIFGDLHPCIGDHAGLPIEPMTCIRASATTLVCAPLLVPSDRVLFLREWLGTGARRSTVDVVPGPTTHAPLSSSSPFALFQPRAPHRRPLVAFGFPETLLHVPLPPTFAAPLSPTSHLHHVGNLPARMSKSPVNPRGLGICCLKDLPAVRGTSPTPWVAESLQSTSEVHFAHLVRLQHAK